MLGVMTWLSFASAMRCPQEAAVLRHSTETACAGEAMATASIKAVFELQSYLQKAEYGVGYPRLLSNGSLFINTKMAIILNIVDWLHIRDRVMCEILPQTPESLFGTLLHFGKLFLTSTWGHQRSIE